jgi:hypothetical protein
MLTMKFRFEEKGLSDAATVSLPNRETLYAG